jgi:hypothetical protein
MKRSRRRSSSSPVTLFPFLAVLVSTMGALVLLLLSISRQVSAQNLAAALAQVLDRVRGDERALTSRRDVLTAQIASIEQRLRATERESRSVDQALVRRDQQTRSDQARLQAAQRELDESRRRRGEIARELAAVQRQLATLETNRRRLNALELATDNSFIPVVHPGSNGTVRRPIFIECTKDGVILQPEAVAIPLTMLDAEVPGENALARAVRALGAYHTRRLQGEDADQPASVAAAYPLLLVRPDGVRPFYAARQSLDETAVPFGYELVEANWALQFPDPDPQARMLAIAAIRRARYDLQGRSQIAALPVGPRGEPGPSSGMMTPHAVPGPSDDNSPPAAMRSNDEATQVTAQVDGQQPSGLAPAGELSEPIGAANLRDPTGSIDDSAANRSTPQTIDTAESPRVDTADVGRDATDSAHRTDSPAGRATIASNATDAADGDEPVHWRLPGSDGAGRRIPIARRIEIVCASDYCVVGSAGAVVHLSERRIDEVVAELVAEVEREVVRWGPSGAMFWWKPELHFHVRPDAIENYYRIRIALAGSSAAVSHEIVWDDRPAAVSGDFLGRTTEPVGLAREMAERFWE